MKREKILKYFCSSVSEKKIIAKKIIYIFVVHFSRDDIQKNEYFWFNVAKYNSVKIWKFKVLYGEFFLLIFM